MNNSRHKRIDVDVRKLSAKYKINYIKGTREFLVNFRGPIGSPYEGGTWVVRVDMPDSYPFKSPSVGFINKIYHPNVDEASGSICLDVINQKWSPIFDLSHIFDHFLPQLLQEPNTGDPLNLIAAQHCFKDHEGFCRRVTEYIEKYANVEQIVKHMLDILPNSPSRSELLEQFSPTCATSNLSQPTGSAVNTTVKASPQGCKSNKNRSHSRNKSEAERNDGCIGEVCSEMNRQSNELNISSNQVDSFDSTHSSPIRANRSSLRNSTISLTTISNITLSLDDPSDIFDIICSNNNNTPGSTEGNLMKGNNTNHHSNRPKDCNGDDSNCGESFSPRFDNCHSNKAAAAVSVEGENDHSEIHNMRQSNNQNLPCSTRNSSGIFIGNSLQSNMSGDSHIADASGDHINGSGSGEEYEDCSSLSEYCSSSSSSNGGGGGAENAINVGSNSSSSNKNNSINGVEGRNDEEYHSMRPEEGEVKECSSSSNNRMQTSSGMAVMVQATKLTKHSYQESQQGMNNGAPSASGRIAYDNSTKASSKNLDEDLKK